MGLFRYYYVAYENVKPKELLARLLKDAWRANRHIEDALAFLSQGKKEKAERACRMAYGLLNEAIDAIHGG